MSKRAVNLNGSPDSRLRPAALHFVSMPPERFDWSDRRPPQASPSPAGLAPAGLAEAAPPQGGAASASALPDLEVRTRREVHQMQAGTTYRIGRDPKSDIVMTDSRVSWRHGVLWVDGDTWIIEDLGSTNGTFLGLQRLDRIEISAECVVRLGNPDDGPVLRCVPQVPAAAAGQVGSPRPTIRKRPFRPLPLRQPGKPSPAPSPSLLPGRLSLPRRATGSRRLSLPRRATGSRRPSASTLRGTPCRRPRPSRPSRSRRTCCRAWTAGPRRGCRCRPRPCASAACPTMTWSFPISTFRGTTRNCANHPRAATRSSTLAAITAPLSTASGFPPSC